MPATATGRGAQVVLDPIGDHAKAARGAYAPTLEANLFKRRSDVAAGLVGDGNTPDGRTTSAGAAVDVLVSPGTFALQQTLYQTTTLVGNGADTTVDVLQTYTVPANTLLNVGDRLIVRAAGSFIGSTDSKTVSVTWGGGGAILNIAVSLLSSNSWKLLGEIIKTASSAQTVAFSGEANPSVVAVGNQAVTRTDTAPIVINIQGQNATTATASSITCRYFTVDVIRG